jgi:hypothetical protein
MYKKRARVHLSNMLVLPSVTVVLPTPLLWQPSSAKEPEEKSLMPKEIEMIRQGKLLVYTHGKLTYQDIFGCDHWITFCQNVSGRPGSSNKAVSKCPEYNDTDDDSSCYADVEPTPAMQP